MTLDNIIKTNGKLPEKVEKRARYNAKEQEYREMLLEIAE